MRGFTGLSLLWLPSVFVYGQDMAARIVGGSDADRNLHPNSIVTVVDREKKLVCGGTLISPTLVMTAAHCAKGILEFAIVGQYDRGDSSEVTDTIPIIAERIHPDFDQHTLDHDVLLLQLERPPTIEVDYMLLNSLDAMPPVGLTLTAMGWGETDKNGTDNTGTDILQRVDLTYVSNDECGSKVNQDEDYRDKITSTMLCTFGQNADHCYGDSGGPILAISPLDPTLVMQVAIISWGADQCADGVFPGVSQRTSPSYDWIANWVCAIDAENDLATKDRYGCEDGQTFSPMPSPAPVTPTLSPAPTAFTVNLWIELFMDEFPEDIAWIVKRSNNGVPVKKSPSYAGNTDDVIIERVTLSPGKSYDFEITDSFGDGFRDGGFYRLSIGSDLESATELFSGNLESTAVNSFTTPPRPKASTPDNAQEVDAPTAAPTPVSTGTPPSAPQTCLDVGESCLAYTECCSGRCNLGLCQKTVQVSGKTSITAELSEDRGGAAAWEDHGGAAGGIRKLRKAPRG